METQGEERRRWKEAACLQPLAGAEMGQHFLSQLKTSGLLIDSETSACTVVLSGKIKRCYVQPPTYQGTNLALNQKHIVDM